MFDGFFEAAGGNILSSVANLWSASQNRDFQKGMSNTAHTREVADLRRAGLNPILSATGGAGLSTPAGATGQVFDLGSAASGARTARANQMSAEAKKSDSRTNMHNADTQQLRQEQDLKLVKAQVKNLTAQTAKTHEEARTAKITADLDAEGAKALQKFGPGMRLLIEGYRAMNAKQK